jgi:hypothetical protein
MITSDDDNFIESSIIQPIVQTFGWTLKDIKTYQEFALIRADFYPIGYIFASSKKAIIICDGETIVVYNDIEYTDVADLILQYGESIIDDFANWHFKVVKEWVIKKHSGEWVSSFSTLKEMPYRTRIRC